MAKQSSKQAPKRRRVRFTLTVSDAAAVCLVGDFNNWNQTSHLMDSDGAGTWSKTLLLAPGVYEYKFMVDGSWVNDSENDQLLLNRFGTHNNWIHIR